MRQNADSLLMVRPSRFGYNPETAVSNTFQNKSLQNDIPARAVLEFNKMADRLDRESINTIIIDDDPKLDTPDSVFPNNWVSMHHDGTMVYYPMATPNRRRERRQDLTEILAEKYGFEVSSFLDLSTSENTGQFLEGTGSIVFDHGNKIAYMSRSVRSSEKVLENLCEKIQYQPFTFESTKYGNQPVYHTNVLMSIGREFAIVCLSAIAAADREGLINRLESSGKTIIDISENQMFAFSGNVLEVMNSKEAPFLVISSASISELPKDRIRLLEQFATLLPIEIPTIEKHGGGSVRCMIAEVFLPKSKYAITTRQVFNEQDLQACFQLRFEVLRKPWGQPLGSERDQTEGLSWHFLSRTADGLPIGTARLHALDDNTAQIRYMAVHEQYRGKGIGLKLLRAAEQLASQKGLKRIFLQSRENAVPFYEQAGYTVIEPTFLLWNEIQHYGMERNL
ncbi:MAG: citrulline utilization hydrolase CtlX [Bacteroidota bacterium]|jgi:N-acetylglutamate synthase-like GNAT family acetyltransferase